MSAWTRDATANFGRISQDIRDSSDAHRRGAGVRDTAVAAERSFWVQRLQALADGWREVQATHPLLTVEEQAIYDCCADDVDALIVERTR